MGVPPHTVGHLTVQELDYLIKAVDQLNEQAQQK